MTAPSIKEALELKPCPFCSSADVVCCDQGDDDFAVTCKSCGASSPFNDDESKVVAAWNTRAALATLSPPAGERREAIAFKLFCHSNSPELWSNPSAILARDDAYALADIALASGLVQDEAGWRDINTAPKDGRYIVVGRFRDDELKWVKHSRWMSAEEACEVEGGASADDYDAGWTDGDDDGDYCYPTHWMPLPAPPIRSARNGGAES